MNAVAVVSIYVVTNRASYLKCDASVSVYVAVVWTPDHPTGPGLLEGLCQTMLLVTIYAGYAYGPGERPENPLMVGLATWLGPVALCWWLRLLLKRQQR